MPAEHIRPFGKHGKGLSQGYCCSNCGEVCNERATGHDGGYDYDKHCFKPWKCVANPKLVEILRELNK